MLQHTFCHLPHIGPRKEQVFWRAGVHTWDHVEPQRLPPRRRDAMLAALDASRAALASGDTGYFAHRLPAGEHWRLFPAGTGRHAARPTVGYLDIETTGMQGHPGDHLTTVVVYDGQAVHSFVHGRNLDDLPDLLAGLDLIVTYNGRTFDLPYLRQWYRHDLFRGGHIDLRYVLARLGLKGGLKACERALGFGRTDTDGLDGYFAVLLWREFRRTGDERCLDTLLAYNADDVLNLQRLMVCAWNRFLERTPFADALTLPAATPPANPFTADRAIVARLARRHDARA